MRCKNCGWDNSQGQIRCEKCNMPLAEEMQGNVEELQEKRPMSSTIKGNIPELPAWDKSETKNISAPNHCEKCNYPLREGSLVCPKCGHNHEKETPQKPFSGTIDPYRKSTLNKSFTLEPISRENEPSIEKIVFNNNEIVLNRHNLDPENKTITSKEQALIKFENGNWYLENKSELQTTYIQVDKPIILQSGDIILFGDRKFKFES